MNSVFDTEQYNYPLFDAVTKQKIKELKIAINRLENNLISPKNNIECHKNLTVDYVNELNASQFLAATTTTGQVLVIAGAGSGKTKTLTYRTSYLIEQGVLPNNILLLTFTRKAANEIKGRAKHLLGNKLQNTSGGDITSGTFHSFCNLLLRRYANLLNIRSQFTILDTGDSEDAIDLVVKEGSFKKIGKVQFPRKKTLQVIISTCRNRRLTVTQLVDKNYPDLTDYIETIEQIAKQYHHYKRKKDLYDFDDIISQVVKHLQTNALFRERVQQAYQHIMVDEYQDTNIPQKELIDLICTKTSNGSLMVVGDDNQSIYAFRGANYQNILLFGNTYPNAKLIKLEQNYRSCPAVLAFVNALSDQITLGYQKSLFSDSKIEGEKPIFSRCSDEQAEAKYIAENIISLRANFDYKDFAVLGRTAYQSNYVQLEFMEKNIPFVVVGGIKFIEKRHIKDVLAFVRVLHNPNDAIAWHRILTILKGIGAVTATKITEAISGSQSGFEPLIQANFSSRSEQLIPLYETLTKANHSDLIEEMLEIILDFYLPVLQSLEENWKERAEDFRVLKGLAKQHQRIEQFLENLALDPPNDSVAVKANEPEVEDVVTISTIHSSKGLEWQVVFVNSLIDGMLPHYKSCDNFEELEEERKLFYVACSRAKTRLFLTAPNYLASYSGYFDKVSRFIAEVPSHSIVTEETEKQDNDEVWW